MIDRKAELERIRKRQIASRFAGVGVCETGGGTSWPDYYERDVHFLLESIDGLVQLTDKPVDAFAKAEQVQSALEVTVESRDILVAEIGRLQAELRAKA